MVVVAGVPGVVVPVVLLVVLVVLLLWFERMVALARVGVEDVMLPLALTLFVRSTSFPFVGRGVQKEGETATTGVDGSVTIGKGVREHWDCGGVDGGVVEDVGDVVLWEDVGDVVLPMDATAGDPGIRGLTRDFFGVDSSCRIESCSSSSSFLFLFRLLFWDWLLVSPSSR